ncbi:MAG: D-alanine--D-alanine ligase [Succinivibrionaceae bacterium]
MNKYNVLLLCGGDSSEHEVSLISANFIESTLKDEVNIYKVIVHKKYWEYTDNIKCFLNNNSELVCLNNKIKIDYVIPCIHGHPGETGDIQSFLEILNLPYLGCKSEACQSCFNKVTTKLWLTAIGIPNTEFTFISKNSYEANIHKCINFFNTHKNVFVKAASQGSSIGCFHVSNIDKLVSTIHNAFKYSDDVLIEKSEEPRELEVAAYEYKNQIIITKPGEIITPSNKFYTYEEKYNNTSNSRTNTCADLDETTSNKIIEYAHQAFVNLKLRDLSRIDFFLTKDNRILLNEINTFPGMTPISMFPKMLEHHGENMKDFFIDRIKHALN